MNAERFYRQCKKIPKGKVSTYLLISKSLNSKAYMVVGTILKNNKNSSVPCHRVVKSGGEVGNYNKGIKLKKQLLKKVLFKF